MAVKRGSYRPYIAPSGPATPERPIEAVMAEVEAVAMLQQQTPGLTLLAALNQVQGVACV